MARTFTWARPISTTSKLGIRVATAIAATTKIRMIVTNEQLCETRFVRITCRATAIRLNPFRMLRAKRVMNLALKLRVTRNFGNED